MVFGKNLARLRKQYRLTQCELGNRIGVSRQTISKWENDEVYPDAYNLVLLSREFNISVDEILFQGAKPQTLHKVNIP